MAASRTIPFSNHFLRDTKLALLTILVLVGISIHTVTHDLQSLGLVRSVALKPNGIIL